MTFSSPSWRSLNLLKGSLNHPKQVTLNHQVQIFPQLETTPKLHPNLFGKGRFLETENLQQRDPGPSKHPSLFLTHQGNPCCPETGHLKSKFQDVKIMKITQGTRYLKKSVCIYIYYVIYMYIYICFFYIRTQIHSSGTDSRHFCWAISINAQDPGWASGFRWPRSHWWKGHLLTGKG